MWTQAHRCYLCKCTTHTEGIFLQVLEQRATAVAHTPNWKRVVDLSKHSCCLICEAIIIITSASSFSLTTKKSIIWVTATQATTDYSFANDTIWIHSDWFVYVLDVVNQPWSCDTCPEQLEMLVTSTSISDFYFLFIN